MYRQHVYDLEEMRGDHVGIYGSKGAEGLSAFNVGLVSPSGFQHSKNACYLYADGCECDQYRMV